MTLGETTRDRVLVSKSPHEAEWAAIGRSHDTCLRVKERGWVQTLWNRWHLILTIRPCGRPRKEPRAKNNRSDHVLSPECVNDIVNRFGRGTAMFTVESHHGRHSKSNSYST